ncbi:helix-turn-helix domain-containing protein [Calidifontibacter terrae]
MTENPLGTTSGFNKALDEAFARLTIADDVALAVREQRRVLGLSQRAYAEFRGCSRSVIARAEAGRSGEMTFDRVRWLLDGSGYVLAVVEQAVDLSLMRPAGAVAGRELVARDEVGRRLPAHLPIIGAPRIPPTWWWARHGGWLTTTVVPAWTFQCPPVSGPGAAGTSNVDSDRDRGAASPKGLSSQWPP